MHEYVEIVRQTGHDNYSYTIHIDAQIRTAFLTAYSQRHVYRSLFFNTAFCKGVKFPRKGASRTQVVCG